MTRSLRRTRMPSRSHEFAAGKSDMEVRIAFYCLARLSSSDARSALSDPSRPLRMTVNV
jgi:hypothetical protein